MAFDPFEGLGTPEPPRAPHLCQAVGCTSLTRNPSLCDDCDDLYWQQRG